MAEKGKLQSSTLFKQIGVDVDFVAQNASKANDRMNDLYWNKINGKRDGPGGQIENVKLPKNLSMIRNYDVDERHSAVQSIAGGVAYHAMAPQAQTQSAPPQMQTYSAPQASPQFSQEAPVVATPGAPAQVAFDHAMIAQLKAELISYIESRVGGLAGMVQQFADQTDKQLADLKRQVNELSVNARPASNGGNGGSRKPSAADSANPEEDTPAAAKMRQQNSINPADVSVSKMFNFSHSGGSGKRQ